MFEKFKMKKKILYKITLCQQHVSVKKNKRVRKCPDHPFTAMHDTHISMKIIILSTLGSVLIPPSLLCMIPMLLHRNNCEHARMFPDHPFSTMHDMI